MVSRLIKHQKKQVRTLIIAAVLFVILFFYIGIPLLAQGSFFFTNLFKGRESTDDNSGQVLGDINVDDIPEATNSSQIIVSGSADNYDKLEFYINDEKVDSVNLNNKSDFSEEIGNLNPGSNEFYILGTAKNSNQKKKSQKYTVLYLRGKPKLEIKEPQDNSKTSHNEIVVSGNTDKGVSVSVNGSPVVVNSNGDFSSSVKLNEGENKIVIHAVDTASNDEEKIITVTYEKD